MLLHKNAFDDISVKDCDTEEEDSEDDEVH